MRSTAPPVSLDLGDPSCGHSRREQAEMALELRNLAWWQRQLRSLLRVGACGCGSNWFNHFTSFTPLRLKKIIEWPEHDIPYLMVH